MSGGIEWTDDDIFYLRKCALVGMTQEQTAQVLGRTISSVGIKSSKEKIPFKRSKALTQEQYITKLIGRPIEVLGTYINNSTRITHQCTTCGNNWQPLPGNIIKGKGCPICNKPGVIPNPSTCSNLYLLSIETVIDTFLKVGISINPVNRVRTLRADIGKINIKSITILDTITGLGGYIYEQEQKIHFNKDLTRYIPKIKFAGHTECYDVCSKDRLLSIFSELNYEEGSNG